MLVARMALYPISRHLVSSIKTLGNFSPNLPNILGHLCPQRRDITFYFQVVDLNRLLELVESLLDVVLQINSHLRLYSDLSHSHAAGILVKLIKISS